MAAARAGAEGAESEEREERQRGVVEARKRWVAVEVEGTGAIRKTRWFPGHCKPGGWKDRSTGYGNRSWGTQ